MSKSNFIIHIGTHKTGSTSIQKFLLENEVYLRSNGLTFLPSPNGKANFKVLFHAACARQRRKLMALRQLGPLGRLFLKQKLRRYIAAAANVNTGANIVVSTELLSLLREPEEIEMLRSLFPPESSLTVVVCLRDKHEFLASMKRQMAAQKIMESGIQGRSNYVKEDSWLVDYDALLAAFQKLTPNVRIVDFGEAARNSENIILPFLRTLGVRHMPAATALPFLNRRQHKT